MSKFAELLHMLVDKSHFHDESQLKDAHALVNDACDELNPSTTAPTEPVDPETPEDPEVKTESSVISNGESD